MKKAVILAFGALLFLVGCKSQANSDTIHLQSQWQGQPYHIAFDTKATKPSPAGITIPDIKYTANPQALENRACLIVRFDPSVVKKSESVMNQIVMGPVDMHGTAGALPADYMEVTDQSLAKLLNVYKVKGKVKVSVMLAMSSISSQPGNDEIAENQLSDWMSTDLVYTPHKGR